ncbi:MAG: PHP domain-containing protein [Gammaproteobacteria bacterium]|nr:PHP domain-containing protein [Gammaproteobacteria bacterium]
MLNQTSLFPKNTAGYDLHTHSTASDGSLSPAELVEAAMACGVHNLAVSDHDTLGGYHLAKQHVVKKDLGINIIPAVEFSSRWNTRDPDDGRGMTVHIVALHIDPEHLELHELLAMTQQARAERNARIKHKMTKKGWLDVFEHAEDLAEQGQLTRTHLARAMLDLKKVSQYRQAFSRYLGEGRPLAVHTRWPNLRESISRINTANGTAVLAHPLHYSLTRKKLLQLCSDFKHAGGKAIEVITGRTNKDMIEQLCGIALRMDLLASVGSDFHSPRNGVAQLGVQQTLPDTLPAVWSNWSN